MEFDPNAREDTPTLAAGWHTMRVVDAEERMSKNGNPMMMVELRHPEQPNGIRIRDYLVATPAALWKVEQALRAMGLGELWEEGRVTEGDIRGRLARVELVEEVVDGYDRPLLKVGSWDTETFQKPAAAPAAPAAKPAAKPAAADKYAHPDTPAGDRIPF